MAPRPLSKSASDTCIKWKCEEERCNGRLRTNLDMENAEESGVHRHGPLEQSVVQAGQLRIALTAEVKLRQHVSLGQVHRELTVDADPNVVTHLTSGPSLKRSLRKTKSINRPRLPRNAEELVVSEHYSQTRNHEVFLIKDEIFEGNRFIFCSCWYNFYGWHFQNGAIHFSSTIHVKHILWSETNSSCVCFVKNKKYICLSSSICGSTRTFRTNGTAYRTEDSSN